MCAETLIRAVCVCVCQDQPAIAAHCFKEGMKLEAVDPAAPISIRPATVTKVTDFPIKSVSAAMLLSRSLFIGRSSLRFLSSLPHCLLLIL